MQKIEPLSWTHFTPEPFRRPYRVLLTGIPLDVTSEVFYDYLQAHVGHYAASGLINALFVCIPEAEASKTQPTELINSSMPKSSSHFCHRKRSRIESTKGEAAEFLQGTTQCRSTGAAFVDFVSKAVAESILRDGLYVSGTRLQWQALGTMILGVEEAAWSTATFDSLLQAEQAGRQAYTNLIESSQLESFPASSTDNLTREEGKESNIFRKDFSCKEDARNALTVPGKPSPEEEVVVRFLAEQPFSQYYAVNTEGDIRLFHDIERMIRGRTMGTLCSLQRISETEVHATVDPETANALLQFKQEESTLPSLSSTVTPMTTNSLSHEVIHDKHLDRNDIEISEKTMHLDFQMERETVVFWRTRRARSLLDIGTIISNGNMSLASKSEVLKAMARLM